MGLRSGYDCWRRKDKDVHGYTRQYRCLHVVRCVSDKKIRKVVAGLFDENVALNISILVMAQNY